MQRLQQFSGRRFAAQRVAEGFRKHIIRPDAVPRLGLQLIFFVTRRRNIAEHQLGHRADFIIVVKHHAAMARHAEVFKQHIAGEDIGRRQLTNRITVLLNGVLALFRRRLHQPQVKRLHATLQP